MENFEVVLSEANGLVGEYAKNLKVDIDINSNVVNITGINVIVTAAGREISTPLSHSQFNNSVEALSSLISSPTTQLTPEQTVKIQGLIDLTTDFSDSIKPILASYMQAIHNINND